MTSISLQQAIELVPAIGSNKASEKVSNSYQFVSSRDILEKVHAYNWRIVDVKGQNASPYAQHRVTLVQEKDLLHVGDSDGVMRIEMFNSHNRTKRLMFAVGFFRFVCSNGLIIATGPSDTLRLRHRFNQDKMEEIMEHVSNISERFPRVLQQIDGFKQRELSEEEQFNYAKFAIRGKINYRANTPKTFSNLDKSAEALLSYRREEDKGNSTWQVYNRIQENIIKGLEGGFRPVRGYSDTIRINQLLWKGAEITTDFKKEGLTEQFNNLLLKDKKKGKISC